MKRQHSQHSGDNKIPRHVAVIMDGNGRWARRHGLPRQRGHSEGSESVRAVVRESVRQGVRELTLYAFSTENWRRPRTEVRFLMNLLGKFLRSERDELMSNNIRLKAIGWLDALPAGVLAELQKSIVMSRTNTGMVLRLALNYGGRQELVNAARLIAREAQTRKLKPEQVTERKLASFLYDEEMTDPDLLIRTGGEMRLSNFLLWQLSYTELWFTKTCWPEFRVPHFRQALRAYARRERRYGGLAERATQDSIRSMLRGR